MLHLLTLFFILISSRDLPNVITLEDDILTGLSLPSHGILCSDVDVMNAPEGTEVLYSVSVGTTIQLREQPRFDHRDWVMIRPAQWIPLSAVCQ